MNSMKAPLVQQVSILFLVLVISLAASWCASAQNTTTTGQSTLSGPVTFSFTSSTAPVYDLTGNYQFSQQTSAGGAPVDLALGFSVQQDAAGRLRGSGVTNVQVGTNLVAARYTVTGTVSGGGGKATRAKFSIRWQSQDSAAAVNGPFTISVQYNLEVSQGLLNGTARGRAKFGKASSSINTSVSAVSLPAGMDGSWRVSMNIQPPGGSGSIILPNGRTLSAKLAGNSSARSGISRVKLSGSGVNRGTTLTMNLVAASSALDSVGGKVLGQTVSLKNLSGSIRSQSLAQASAASQFAGSQACLECHTPIQQTLNLTRHAQVGVQCENCHGPAANHAANDYDPLSRPTLPYAGTSCGTCHSSPQQPIYQEWQASEHSEVVEDLNPPDRISSCGRCHSGSVRVNLVDGTPLPVGGANEPLGCPTCHQPHQVTGQPDQLRNPLFSTNDYFLTTTSVFTNNYNPSINLCGQCHNHRGASWTISSRPPHRSPQYNMLLGTVGVLDPNNPDAPHSNLATHAYAPKQCVTCHMQAVAYQSPSQPGTAGHAFGMITNSTACGGSACHGRGDVANLLVPIVKDIITTNPDGLYPVHPISEVQSNLVQWAIRKAPAILGTTEYGTNAWAYSNYTPPDPLAGGPGPNADLQLRIPTNIKIARFNLYLVQNDGSFGTHNFNYAVDLLNTAYDLVNAELAK